MTNSLKRCSSCGECKPLSEFRSRGGKKAHLKVSWCDACRSIKNQEAYARLREDPDFMAMKRRRSAEWAKENPSAYLDRQLRWRYGISLEEYLNLFEVQNGLCAICHIPPSGKRLAVDHDHRTGKVRGLLCEACNHGIGKFLDNTDRLRSAIVYLETHAD